MGFKIIWTKQALDSFQANIEFLLSKWTPKEVNNFTGKVSNILKAISQHPEIFRKSVRRQNIRWAVITPQISLIYRVKSQKKEIELLNFRGNRRNPGEDKHR